MADNQETTQQMNERHLKLAGELQRVALEIFKDEAEQKQCSFADLIAEVKAQGEDVSPEVEKLILEAEGKV